MNEKFPTLVVMSKTLLRMWRVEGVEKFFQNDAIQALYYHKSEITPTHYKEITGREMAQYDIVFTTYDAAKGAYRRGRHHLRHCKMSHSTNGATSRILRVNHRLSTSFNPDLEGEDNLYLMPWARVVCDESQTYANPNTQVFRAMMGLYGDHRWCLTGTAIRNYDTDLATQLFWCGFNRIERPKKWKAKHFQLFRCERFLYILDYEKAQVSMPPLIELTHPFELETRQRQLYRTILKEMHDAFAVMFENQGVSYDYILALFTGLRQVVLSPTLLAKRSTGNAITRAVLTSGGIQQVGGSTPTDPAIERWMNDIDGSAGADSPKMVKMANIVQEKAQQGEKTIIFSSFVSALRVAKKALTKRGIKSELLIGSVRAERRMEIVSKFKSNDGSSPTALLIHYKVGSEGIDLTRATNVIPLEPWWTNAVHQQGIFRAWRRGQTKPVRVHWILAKNTIEKRILDLCDGKSAMADMYIKHKGRRQPGAAPRVVMDKRTLISLIDE